MVKEYGLYDYKLAIQIGLMLIIFILCAIGMAYFARLTRSASDKQQYRQRLIAFSGVAFTLCFVIVRAISLAGVDKFLSWRLAGMKMNWVFENVGILLVVIGAFLAVKYSKGITVEA